MTRAGLYLRVSTERQTTDNQRADLERLAAARGWSVRWFQDEGVSGSKMRRPGLDALREAARRGELEVAAVWALDRFGRSMTGVVELVLELDRVGVQVVSVREAWLDTAGPVRSLLLAIFGWVAEQEKARLVERTRAGLDRARREGKRLGRPKASALALEAAAELVRRGAPLVVAARTKGVGASTLRRYLGAQGVRQPQDIARRE